MPKRFDPYHAWLGIPAEEQPPNHYRLLGIPLFETNEDVIQNGLDQRMAHVKSFATGPHSDLSQRLLTELSQAGVCLLRPERKEAYDRELKSELVANTETVALQSSPATAPTPQVTPGLDPGLSPAPSALRSEATGPSGIAITPIGNKHNREPVKSEFPIIPLIVGGVIGLSIACLVLFLISFGRGSGNSNDRNADLGLASRTGEIRNRLDKPDPKPKTDGAASAPEVSSEKAPDLPKDPQSVPDDTGMQSAKANPALATSPFGNTKPQQTDWPTTGAASSPPSFLQSTSPAGDTPAPTQATSPASAPSETRKSVVLDLERSAMYVTLAEEADDKGIQARVERITGLTTSYDLRPNSAVIALGKSLDIVLTQYEGVRIHLSMQRKGGNAELKIVPELETSPGKTIDFSQRTLDQASRAMKKDATSLSKQLVAAQREALAIQNAMRSPAPAPVRTAQRQRLNLLTTRTIPALQQQLSSVQANQGVLSRLASLVKQIHEKATLDLVVQITPSSGKK